LQVDNSYLYREGDRYVIFDETGPGVVWRIWMMGLDGLFQGALAGDVRVKLNDEPRPRLARPQGALRGDQGAVRRAAGRRSYRIERGLLLGRAHSLRAAAAHLDLDRPATRSSLSTPAIGWRAVIR